jgi:DNA-binding GntR family transcriptional regulator
VPVPDRESAPTPRRRLLTDDVFDRLRDDIVRGYLAPGQRIHDLELAQSLGFSRATVRTALLRLTQLGLVETVPNLYTRVTEIDVPRYLDTQDTAGALYVFACRFGVPLMTDDAIDAMTAWSHHIGSRDTVDPEAVFSGRADVGFFRRFVDSLGNVPLTRTIERLRPTLQRVSGQFAHLIPARETDETLLAVVEAVTRRDGAAAASRLARYYDGPLAVFHERLAAERPANR